METLTIILLCACNSKGSVVETLTNLCIKYASLKVTWWKYQQLFLLSLYAPLAPLEGSAVEPLVPVIMVCACNSKGSVVETLTNLCTKYTSGGDVVEISTAIFVKLMHL